MKNHVHGLGISLLAVLVSVACLSTPLYAASATATATATAAPAPAPAPTISEILTTEIDDCNQPVPAVDTASRRVFSDDRIRQTLHGVWKGKVWGEYPEEVLDSDGFVNVDYYIVIDTVNAEALIIEQLSDERSAPAPSPAVQVNGKAPTWSYLMCGKAQYVPAHPRQVHEFTKVSNNVNDARTIVEQSTGLKIPDSEFTTNGFVVADTWQKLVDGAYFDDLKYPAYAGGLFKPFNIGNRVNASGENVFELYFDAEYRGGGATAAEFEPGVPIRGYETAQFIGVSTSGGDFLLASALNGAELAKEAFDGGLIDVFFEKVVIGPLFGE